jgi:hypothetical protein
MPIIVADERAPGQLLIPANTTIYEVNPWEIGTFDPTTFGFAPLRYVGSNFSGGVLPPSEHLVFQTELGVQSAIFFKMLVKATVISQTGRTRSMVIITRRT